MAKKDTKTYVLTEKKEAIIDKVMATVEYLTPVIAGVAGIWTSFDVSVYATAGCGAIVSVLAFVKLFVK